MNPITCESQQDILDLMRRLRAMGDEDYLRHLIVYHAAPTVQGVKPATLLCPGATDRDLEGALERTGEFLETLFGVRVATFRNRCGSLLLLVYRLRLLENALAVREVAELLKEAGYRVEDARIEALFSHLREKCSNEHFPHEIGVFLGYPACDVRRFMTEGGRGCRNAGCWKAFGDAGSACDCSHRYRSAKLLAAKMIAGGADLGAVVQGLRKAV